MDIKLFVNITSRAWTLPILSSLHIGVPGRQATLLTAIGASRTAFAQSMQYLIEIGLMERNPGHGHPLRPEFRLTQLGIQAAAVAHQIQNAPETKDRDLLRKRWTVPVLMSLQEPLYFNDIKRSLTAVTDRALSQSLKMMETRNWIKRTVNEVAHPPRAKYSSINAGQSISKVLDQDTIW